jgi:putative ABC transport system permease protein
MARLAAINGKPVEEIAREHVSKEGENRLWALTREQRLTYLETLPPDNEVVVGKLWSLPGTPELSVEEKFAKRTLGIGPGAVLQFDIQGITVSFTVTSLRRVDWRTFGINFFWVAEPGTLDAAPQSRLAAARIPEERESFVQDRLARTSSGSPFSSSDSSPSPPG